MKRNLGWESGKDRMIEKTEMINHRNWKVSLSCLLVQICVLWPPNQMMLLLPSQDPSSVLHTADADAKVDPEILPTKAKKAKKKGKLHSNPNSREPLTKSEKKSRTLGDIALSREARQSWLRLGPKLHQTGHKPNFQSGRKGIYERRKSPSWSSYPPGASSFCLRSFSWLVNFNSTCRHAMYARNNSRVKQNSSRTSITQGMHLHRLADDGITIRQRKEEREAVDAFTSGLNLLRQIAKASVEAVKI
jgi:hypothetical protein